MKMRGVNRGALAALIGLVLTSFALAAPPTPGNLVVIRLGDGTQTLANTGNSVFLDEYTPAGVLVSSTPVPDAGANALIISGSATSEGTLSASGDHKSLWFAGYNIAQATSVSSLASSLSSAVARGVGSFDQAGNVTLAATTSINYSGNNIRGAVSDNGTNIFGAGGIGGTILFPSTTIQSTYGNIRATGIFNDKLYFTVKDNTLGGVYEFSSVPTAADTPTRIINTGTGNANEFAISPDGKIIYVADDRTSANGGVQRWDFNGAIWSLSYTLQSGVASIGARGLSVDFSGTNPVIFATTGEATANRIITITDTGATSTATTLATAGNNQIFRGLESAPVPEPGTVGLLCLGATLVLNTRRRSPAGRN